MNVSSAISLPGWRNPALSASSRMSSAQCKCLHFPKLSNLHGIFPLFAIMGPSGWLTVGHPAREAVGNGTLASPQEAHSPVKPGATTLIVLKWMPVPRPFCFLPQLFSQTFPSPKFILIYQKGHWFKNSAFQIWLPPALLFSLPHLQWLIPQHYDLILPSKYAILHPDKYLGKNQLLHMHAQTR